MYSSHDLDFEAFSYHNSNTEPLTDQYNIIGLELELINIIDHYSLNEAIDNYNIDTWGRENGSGVQLEEDSSVEYEVIFNADTPENIKKRVGVICDYLENTTNNTAGTSAHIHINKDWLDIEGVNELDIIKASEVLRGLIYAISGRSVIELINWASFQNNLSQLTTDAPQLNSGRYNAVNCENLNTIELRYFSNRFNFNYQYINLYIDFALFLINNSLKTADDLKESAEEFIKGYYSFLSEEQVNLINLFFSDDEKAYKKAFYEYEFIFNKEEHLKKINYLLNNTPFYYSNDDKKLLERYYNIIVTDDNEEEILKELKGLEKHIRGNY